MSGGSLDEYYQEFLDVIVNLQTNSKTLSTELTSSVKNENSVVKSSGAKQWQENALESARQLEAANKWIHSRIRSVNSKDKNILSQLQDQVIIAKNELVDLIEKVKENTTRFNRLITDYSEYNAVSVTQILENLKVLNMNNYISRINKAVNLSKSLKTSKKSGFCMSGLINCLRPKNNA